MATLSYIITIPKNKVKLKNIKDFTSAIFIDNSGSTCGQLVSANTTILNAELSICQSINFNSIVLWNTTAEICHDMIKAKPNGGTTPRAIFDNEKTRSVFHKSDVIVFVTDGEIDNKSVTELGVCTKDRLNKVLIICIIVNKKLDSPSKINISVVAPLMMGSNVLCLFYDGLTFYILSSKGYIAQFYKSSDDFSNYDRLNTLNISELFHNVKVYESLKLPNGYIAIREDEEHLIAFNFDQLINTEDIDSIKTINDEDWKTLIQYAKIGNRLSDLRSFVNRIRQKSVNNTTKTLEEKFDFKYTKERDTIIKKIVQLKTTENENENENELNILRTQLHQINDRAKIEELEFVRYINENLHQTRRFWNNIQTMIHQQEVGSYSINDFTFSSNRANRAKSIDSTDNELVDTIHILDYEGVPMFECSICMEQGPQILWLRSPLNLDDSTNDYIINFPLQHCEKLSSCLVANPVCGHCARAYIQAATTTNKNGLTTLYREPCSGFIPLKWSTDSNRHYANNILYKTLTRNKVLPHVQMLLLALVDDLQASWLAEDTKVYFIHQLVEHIYTTDSFSDEGTRMILIDAFKQIIKKEDKLMRQPWTAVCRILHFNYDFHRLKSNVIVSLLRKRFFMMCIETFCSKTKFGPEHLKIIKQQLYEIIFDSLCGIPIQNTLVAINIDNEQVKEFFGIIYKQFIYALEKLANQIRIDRSNIISPEIISFVLYLLTNIPVHDRPMKLYMDFALKEAIIRHDMNVNWLETKENINKHLFGQYHPMNKFLIPGYAINLGQFSCPSKLFFFTEPLWDVSIENQQINVSILTNQVKSKLEKKLENWNGTTFPSPTSAHYLLHKIVAQILEEHYPQAEKITAKMIIDCIDEMRRTAGKKGNIHAEYVFPSIVLTIDDYLHFRKTTTNMSITNNETKTRSYEYKIIAELISNGMEYDAVANEVNFNVSRLRKPRLIDRENTTIDFTLLKTEVQQLYLKSKLKDNDTAKRSCFTIEMKEFIEFDYKMDVDVLLPIWAQEQQNIVTSIIVDVDQIDEPIKYVAGLDISFVKTNDKAVASMVIFDYKNLEIVAKISVNCNMKIPYIAGYLAFREAPVFMKIIDILTENCPELTPQVILMDGNGVWHPRRAGIASHFGVLSGIPCFGVSKNVLVADGINQEKVETLLIENAPNEDQFVEVVGDSGAILGLAYNVTGFIKNAVYISAGHKITLPTACKIFQAVTKYRITEPIRQADLLSRELVNKLI